MSQQPGKMVENTSAIARLANRVLIVARQEADNSEDTGFIHNLARAADQLQGSKSRQEIIGTSFTYWLRSLDVIFLFTIVAVPPMVHAAKDVALSPNDHSAAGRWRNFNNEVTRVTFKIRF